MQCVYIAAVLLAIMYTPCCSWKS